MPLDLSAEEFLRLADRFARLAADHLRRLDGDPIQPRVDGASLTGLLGGDPPERGRREGLVALLRPVLDGARAQNGRFLGYVMGSGEPAGAAADLLASVLNQNLTGWRSSPSGVTLEQPRARRAEESRTSSSHAAVGANP